MNTYGQSTRALLSLLLSPLSLPLVSAFRAIRHFYSGSRSMDRWERGGCKGEREGWDTPWGGRVGRGLRGGGCVRFTSPRFRTHRTGEPRARDRRGATLRLDVGYRNSDALFRPPTDDRNYSRRNSAEVCIVSRNLPPLMVHETRWRGLCGYCM